MTDYLNLKLMKRSKLSFWQLLSLPIVGFNLGFFTTSADASVYANKSGTTRVAISEQLEKPGEELGGDYITQAAGRTWTGQLNLKPNPKGNLPGRQNYRGTFKDFTTGPETQLVCTGDVNLTIITDGKNRKQLIINWAVKAGEKCPSIGQKFSLNLSEAFPTPDKNGDFKPENADDWNGGTQDSTWRSWRVVTGSLNCRATPQGKIQKSYKNGTPIAAQIDRSGSAIVGSDGKQYPFKGDPWLRTKDACYVRANSQYIQPASDPF